MRDIKPEEIRPGQTIRVWQRWARRGAMTPYTKEFRGVVSNVRGNFVAFEPVEGEISRPAITNGSDYTVEITLISEPEDPRLAVVKDTVSEWWNSDKVTSDSLAKQIVAALDGLRP